MTNIEIFHKLMFNQFIIDVPEQKPLGYGIMGIQHKDKRIVMFNPENQKKEHHSEVEFRFVNQEWFDNNYIQPNTDIKLIDITENNFPIISVED